MRFKAYCVHSMLLASGTDIRKEIFVVVYSHEVDGFQLLVVGGLMNVCLRQNRQGPRFMGGCPVPYCRHLKNKLLTIHLFFPVLLQRQHWQPPKGRGGRLLANGFAGSLSLNITLDFKISKFLPQNIELGKNHWPFFLTPLSLLLSCNMFSFLITPYS